MKRTHKQQPKTRISIDNAEIVAMVDDIKSQHVAKLTTTAVIHTALKRWQNELHAAQQEPTK